VCVGLIFWNPTVCRVSSKWRIDYSPSGGPSGARPAADVHTVLCNASRSSPWQRPRGGDGRTVGRRVTGRRWRGRSFPIYFRRRAREIRLITMRVHARRCPSFRRRKKSEIITFRCIRAYDNIIAIRSNAFQVPTAESFFDVLPC